MQAHTLTVDLAFIDGSSSAGAPPHMLTRPVTLEVQFM